jgi:rhodanese-related sulfurtransferase
MAPNQPERLPAGSGISPIGAQPTGSRRERDTRLVEERPSRIDEALAEARQALPHRPAAAELPSLRATGALVVDIRPSEQRSRDGELPGAIVIDRNVLEWRLDPTSPDRIPEATGPDRVVVLVCNEGYASSLAAAGLQRLGLLAATDLDGGFQAVLAAGLLIPD